MVAKIRWATCQEFSGRVQPFVSVVIPSYNRAAELQRCLETFKNAEYGAFEIIVVDDGSTDTTREVVRAFPDVRYLYQTRRGPGAARNLGARHAKGEILAFTDSDCVVDRRWLRELVESLSSDVAMVGGRTVEVHPSGIMRYIHPSEGLVEGRDTPLLSTNNMAVLREVFEDVGGFDETYAFACEDLDFCLRALLRGHRMTTNDRMLVTHLHPHPGFFGWLRKVYSYQPGFLTFLRGHPDFARFDPFYPLKIPLAASRCGVREAWRHGRPQMLPLLTVGYFLVLLVEYLGRLNAVRKDGQARDLLYTIDWRTVRQCSQR